jgi:hypothetical protein
MSGSAVASQLVKLLVMVVIVNLYTITRLNITDCNIGGCGKIGTHGNKWLVDQKYVRYKYVPYQYTEYQYVLLCHSALVEWALSLLTGPGTWLSGGGPRGIWSLGDFIDVYLDDRTPRSSARLHDVRSWYDLLTKKIWTQQSIRWLVNWVLSDRKVTECYLIAR